MTIYTKQNLANEEKKPEDELKFDLSVEVPVDTVSTNLSKSVIRLVNISLPSVTSDL